MSPGSSVTIDVPPPQEASRAKGPPPGDRDSVPTCAPSPLSLPRLSLPPQCPGPVLGEHWQMELGTRWQNQEQRSPWQPGGCAVLSWSCSASHCSQPLLPRCGSTGPPYARAEAGPFPQVTRTLPIPALVIRISPLSLLSGSLALAPSLHCSLPKALSPLMPIHPTARIVIWGELKPGLTRLEKGWVPAPRETGMEHFSQSGGSDQTRMLKFTLCTEWNTNKGLGRPRATTVLAPPVPTPFCNSDFPPLSKSCLICHPCMECQRPRVQLHLGFIST